VRALVVVQGEEAFLVDDLPGQGSQYSLSVRQTVTDRGQGPHHDW